MHKTLPQALSITVTHHSVSDTLLGTVTSHLHSQSTPSVQSSPAQETVTLQVTKG